jgi:hypothetical protein
MDSIYVYWRGERRKERESGLVSGKQPGSLGEITEQQADPKGKKTRDPQGSGLHLADTRQPPLHGLGKKDIRNRFQNKEQAKHGYKEFHGRTLPVDRSFFKAATRSGWRTKIFRQAFGATGKNA